jgi:deoxyadenosine/deoxycytidine kinase
MATVEQIGKTKIGKTEKELDLAVVFKDDGNRVKPRGEVWGDGDGWLIEVPEIVKQLDCFPRSYKTSAARQWPEIGIKGDSFGIGTSTAAEVLIEEISNLGLPVHLIPEEPEKNKFLSGSYQDQGQRQDNFLKSQIYFLVDDYIKLERAPKGAILIHDRPPEADMGFAIAGFLNGKMREEDFPGFIKLCQTISWQEFFSPTLMVDLRASHPVLWLRMQQSYEDFEKGNVPQEYVKTLKAVNRAWSSKAEAIGYSLILPVDTDQLDFSVVSSARKELTRRVLTALVYRGYQELKAPLTKLNKQIEVEMANRRVIC